MPRKVFLLLFLLTLVPLFAIDPPENSLGSDDNGDGRDDRWEVVGADNSVKTYSDTNNDGRVDYILEYDEEGFKIYEALDFNEDGEIDDHYYYTRDVLQRREIDTNFDGDVDVWVYLSEGVYVSGYKRDTDFDGEIDLEKSFGSEE